MIKKYLNIHNLKKDVKIRWGSTLLYFFRLMSQKKYQIFLKITILQSPFQLKTTNKSWQLQ